MMRQFVIVLVALLISAGTVFAVDITQSTDTTFFEIGGDITCTSGGTHFLRRFNLPGDHGITGAFTVGSVTFGASTTSIGGAGQPVTVNIYSIAKADPFVFANLTLIGTYTDPTFPDVSQNSTLPVTATLTDPNNFDLVVDITSPGAVGNLLFVTKNNAGEIAPGYWSGNCVSPEPAIYTYGDLIMIVTGSEALPPTPVGAPIDMGSDNGAQVYSNEIEVIH